jgi:hypothetical protein
MASTKRLITKNQDLDLDAFLHSIICLLNKNINKHLDTIFGDTNDDKFSLINFLDFNPIKNYFKLCVSSCINRMILDNSWQDTTCGLFIIVFTHQEKINDYLTILRF